MTEVISVKFKNRGKTYFFDPCGKTVESGEQVIVETAKGLEIADCCRGNHMVEDAAVIQPLRPMIRIATADDRRTAEHNKQREKDAYEICQRKIAEHGLDMKLVDVECNFEGSKTLFFFTSDGRVDFRELVKDLAGIFRNRIELRQIGVRDEAKMLGGLGICGRPFCCSKFLEDFQPVSTKMAKVQSMSLNPSKISGTCGRLMCCLRYEQEAYEDLVKSTPKQGAFVETPDGYGTVTQVNLLRQLVKVKLDGEGDDTVRNYKAEAVATVPGGRPKDGDVPPSVLKYTPIPEEPEEDEREWKLPDLFAEEPNDGATEAKEQKKSVRSRKNNKRKRTNTGNRPNVTAAQHDNETEPKATVKAKPKTHHQPQQKPAAANAEQKPKEVKAQKSHSAHPAQTAENAEKPASSARRNYYRHGKQRQKQDGRSAK